MEWKELLTEQDIQELQDLYGNFLDAKLVDFRFESGNYVDEELVGHEYMNNDLYVVFQRQDISPFSIEVHFEEMRRINFYAPLCTEFSAYIYYAKFVKADGFIYWTKWRDFDASLLGLDVTFIEAKRVKWRIIS